MKNNKFILWGGLGLILVILIVLYNGLVSKRESARAQWQKVESAYQARMDKTKNLFEIVLSSSEYEGNTLKEIIEARSKATSIQLNADDLTPEKLAEFQKAQDAFGSSLGRLLAVAENYPQLKAVDAFRDFQLQYEGMENRIQTERNRYNDFAKEYNLKTMTFPSGLIASVFNFTKLPYFEADEGAEKAPDIKGMKENR